MNTGITPVNWFEIENWITPKEEWEVPEDISWVKYNNQLEYNKKTTTSTGWWTEIVDILHSKQIISLCSSFFRCGLESDPTLHGAGGISSVSLRL
jgi:hypothetical protein